MLKTSSDARVETLLDLESPDFAGETWGLRLAPSSPRSPICLFSTVADGPIGHDRGAKMARPAHRSTSRDRLFSDQAGGLQEPSTIDRPRNEMGPEADPWVSQRRVRVCGRERRR